MNANEEKPVSSVVKQVLVWRKDLKVRKGKVAAQLSHAAMSPVFNMMKANNEGGRITYTIEVDEGSPFALYKEGRFTKIVCYVENEAELLALYATLTANHIPVSLITDAGLTEFNGVPTNTCIGIGPVLAEVVDPFTKHLPLL